MFFFNRLFPSILAALTRHVCDTIVLRLFLVDGIRLLPLNLRGAPWCVAQSKVPLADALSPYEATGLLVCWKRFKYLGKSDKDIATASFPDPCDDETASRVPSSRAHRSGARIGRRAVYGALPSLGFRYALHRSKVPLQLCTWYFVKNIYQVYNFLAHNHMPPRFRNAYPNHTSNSRISRCTPLRQNGLHRWPPLIDAAMIKHSRAESNHSTYSNCCKGLKGGSCGFCWNQLVVK